MPTSSFSRTGVGGFFVQCWGSYIFIATGYDFSPVLHIHFYSSYHMPSLDGRPLNAQNDRFNKNDGMVY